MTRMQRIDRTREPPGPQTAPGLRLCVIDGLRVMSGAALLHIPSRKAQAMLAMLAMSPQGVRSRDWLRDTLWSDTADRGKQQRSLRAALHVLRRAFVEAGLPCPVDGQVDVVLDRRAMVLDLDELFDSLETGPLDARALHDPMLLSRLLAETEDLGEAYRDWLYAERASREATLLRRADAAMSAPAVAPAHRRDLALFALAHDPLNNRAALAAMRALDELNDPAAALAVYERLWREMDEAYEQEPAVEAQAFYVALKSRGEIAAAPPPPAPAPGPTPPSTQPTSAAPDALSTAAARPEDPLPRVFVELAALDFAPPDRGHVAAAFRDDLVGSLIRFREWRTVDCTGPIARYAPAMGACPCFRLAISAFDAGGELVLGVRLNDARTDVGLWSERIECGGANWWSAQGAIVRRLAVALNIRLQEARLRGIEARPDAGLEVYDAWLRAEALFLEGAPDAWRRAEALLGDLLQRHPGFVRGHCSRANVANARHFRFAGLHLAAEDLRIGMAHSSRAVELDPLDGRAQLCHGWSQALAGRWRLAVRAFEAAQFNNPNDPWTMISVAVGLAFCGKPQRSVELADQAKSIEFAFTPLHWSYDAVVRFLAGDYAGCVRASEEAGDSAPDMAAWHGAALALSGRTEEAREIVGAFLEETRGRWHGEGPPDDRGLAAWILQCYPIRDAATWGRLRSGLSAAGLAAAADLHASLARQKHFAIE